MLLPSGDWWGRQFVECLKEISELYDCFNFSREIEYLEAAEKRYEQCTELYELRNISFLELSEFGRGLRGRQAP